MNIVTKRLLLFIVLNGFVGQMLYSTPSSKLKDSNIINLSGVWQFSFDTASLGVKHKWFNKSLTGKVTLPGTLAENKKGIIDNYKCRCLINCFDFGADTHCKPYNDTTTFHLTNLYPYEGRAWYRKVINVPSFFRGKHIELIMERTKVTHLWVDSTYIGSNNLLSAAQVFNLSGKLSEGKHVITIMVDNTKSIVPTGWSHMISYDIQTNWNGIIGDFYIKASSPSGIQSVNVYPDVESKTAKLKVHLRNIVYSKGNKLHFQAKCSNSRALPPLVIPIHFSSKDTIVEVNYSLGTNAKLWSNHCPSIYQLHTQLIGGTKIVDSNKTSFGLRQFVVKGTQFEVNGAKIMLRGKHDGCVWPLTGRPPMNTLEWTRYYRIIKEYGLNHVRFHSWCPPKAAFQAADELGIFLQVECPYWGNYTPQDTALIKFMTNEGLEILKQYGNHPSFVMMTLGNELGGDSKLMDSVIANFKAVDDRHLYEMSSNGFLTNPKIETHDDFMVTARTGVMKPDYSTDVRSAFAEEDNSCGLINKFTPSTQRDYSNANLKTNIPVVGHEIGQFQVYPDYREIDKYSGFLKPLNLEKYRSRLKQAGMLDQADAFFKSTGQSALILYREEIEAALRTPNFGGFQLLDLQDYPGQGTALIGILNSFMESKGIITPKKFRWFCNDVVPLLVMKKYCWSNTESFTARIKVSNYSPSTLKNKIVSWTLSDPTSGSIVASNKISAKPMLRGCLSDVDSVNVLLASVKSPVKLLFRINIEGTAFQNEYPIWVYPSINSSKINNDVVVTRILDKRTLDHLKSGGKVMLYPDFQKNENRTVSPQFINEFWNWLMFKNLNKRSNKPESAGTMGILVDPKHDLFCSFPTETHNNWQWWQLCSNARPYILDHFLGAYLPIVQVIDNVDRNHKLGILFEFRVGNGKVLVCMANVPALAQYPEMNQLNNAMIDYVNSSKFNPTFTISEELLNQMFD